MHNKLKIGILVPTLFSRDAFLTQNLASLRNYSGSHVALMGPDVEKNAAQFEGMFDQIIEEPKTGTLSAKINFGLRMLPPEIEFVTWLGDDDTLEKGSLELRERKFKDSPSRTLVFGGCKYVDSHGVVIGKNPSWPHAISHSRFGPFLAPQPGSVFRRSTFESIGGLDESLKLAFDYDLFLRLRKAGPVGFIDSPVASFRWHQSSLSVSQRRLSVREASTVRLKNSHGFGKLIVAILNPMVEMATLLAGHFVQLGLRAKSERLNLRRAPEQ